MGSFRKKALAKFWVNQSDTKREANKVLCYSWKSKIIIKAKRLKRLVVSQRLGVFWRHANEASSLVTGFSFSQLVFRPSPVKRDYDCDDADDDRRSLNRNVRTIGNPLSQQQKETLISTSCAEDPSANS